MKQRQNPYAEILEEVGNGLWEHDVRVSDGIAEPYPYTNKTFRACLKIFMAGIMWKLWEQIGGEEEKGNMAEEMGNEIRGIVLKYTGIDTHELYKNNS